MTGLNNARIATGYTTNRRPNCVSGISCIRAEAPASMTEYPAAFAAVTTSIGTEKNKNHGTIGIPDAVQATMKGSRRGTINPMASPEIRKMVLAAVAACEEKKGEDTRVLELDPADSGFTDFFVITSSTNDRQTVAIADEVEFRLKREFGVYANSVEGRRQGEWVLLDYVDFVVHVFLAERRAYYDIERLRKSAQSIDVAELKSTLAQKTLAARKKAAAKKTRETVSKSSAKKAAKPAAKKPAKSPAKKAVKKSATPRVKKT